MNFKDIETKYNIRKNIITKEKKNYLNKKTFQGGDFYFWGYDKIYEKYCKSFKDKKINICEIGILEGDKLFILNNYFTNCSLFGYDIDISKFKYQNDIELMKNIVELKVCNSTLNENIKIKYNFDIIIDDGDHNPFSIIKTFENLFPLLNKGGIYFIEDVTILKEGRLLTLKNYFLQNNIKYKFEINHQGFKKDKYYHGIIIIYK